MDTLADRDCTSRWNSPICCATLATSVGLSRFAIDFEFSGWIYATIA